MSVQRDAGLRVILSKPVAILGSDNLCWGGVAPGAITLKRELSAQFRAQELSARETAKPAGSRKGGPETWGFHLPVISLIRRPRLEVLVGRDSHACRTVQ